MKIGIVAGEVSGDILGGRLMAAIREREADVRFSGVGGEAMLAEGLEALAPLSALSVNGFKDPLLRLPGLYRLLAKLRRHFVAEEVDAVVGVDFNVFNLLLERGVKKRGIATAHYVSPSVYFWRRGRIKRIRRAADVVLALFPFEPPLYADHGARAIFVGHPLADEIGLDDGSESARQSARQAFGVATDGPVVALLPGSRRSEIEFLGRLFADAATCLNLPEALFLVPAPSQPVYDAMAAVLDRYRRETGSETAIQLVQGQSRTVIAAADAVLTKSGTATLETMMLRRPMVVAYRLGALSAWLVRRLKTSDFVALPNILAGRQLVPELLQEDAQPAKLAAALQAQMRGGATAADYLDACAHWHQRLRQGGAGKAAEAVLGLIAEARRCRT